MESATDIHTTLRRRLISATLALWAVFFIAVHTMLRDGPWVDELWSLWTVRPPTLAETLARVNRDFHPPLYFLMLDGWLALTSDSVVALRLPSAFFGTLGAAGTYALGRRLFDHQTAALAVIILGTASFFRYYAGETRMYSLLLLVSVLCMIAFLRWLDRPTPPRSVLYGIALAALPYTHYHGVWIVAAQAVYVLLFRRDRLVHWLAPTALAVLLFLPWLPVLLTQNADRPLLMVRAAAPSNLDTLRWIVWFMTGGVGACYLLPALALPDLRRLRQHARPLALVLLWLILAPALVLLVNTRAAFFYHPRYLIGILPAGALLAAFGARIASWRLPAYAVLAAVIAMQVSRYSDFWPSRSAAFGDFFDSLAEIQPGDALILDLDPDNLVDYYDTHYAPQGQPGLRQQATLDLTGAQHDFAGVLAIHHNISLGPRLWLILPSNVPRSWLLFNRLDDTHHATYAGSIMNMLFYRLERGEGGDLSYQFGDLVELRSRLPAGGIIEVPQGELVCPALSLAALAPLDGRYSLGIHVVGMDGVSRAQWDGGLDVRAGGEEITLAPCVEGAAALPGGEYALYLTVYDWSTLIRLPVLEVSTGKEVPWGDTLILSYLRIATDRDVNSLNFRRGLAR